MTQLWKTLLAEMFYMYVIVWIIIAMAPITRMSNMSSKAAKKVVEFIEKYYDYFGENDIFNELMKAGLITPMH
jgi:hypothetical protein